jgi:hypothetical protein
MKVADIGAARVRASSAIAACAVSAVIATYAGVLIQLYAGGSVVAKPAVDRAAAMAQWTREAQQWLDAHAWRKHTSSRATRRASSKSGGFCDE